MQRFVRGPEGLKDVPPVERILDACLVHCVHAVHFVPGPNQSAVFIGPN